MTSKFQIFRRKWRKFYNFCKSSEKVNSAGTAENQNNSFVFEMETFQTCNGPTVEEILREGKNGNIQEYRLPRII